MVQLFAASERFALSLLFPNSIRISESPFPPSAHPVPYLGDYLLLVIGSVFRTRKDFFFNKSELRNRDICEFLKSKYR